MGDPYPSSLTRRLLLVLVAPMAALALLLGIGGAITINSIVESVNDRLLVASANAIAETISVQDGELTVDLPPFALGMLENESRDNVFYSVRLGPRLVTGYGSLPVIPPAESGSTEPAPLMRSAPTFMYATYRDLPIRIAAINRRVTGAAEPVSVQVAETLEARQVLKQRMMLGLIVLESVLLGFAALILPRAVGHGLRPLAAVKQHIDRRRPDDFAPLPATEVPLELRSLIAAFNSLLARLEAATEGMRRFTADASHQMRTPLTILRTHLSVLRQSGMNSEVGAASLQDIEVATTRLQRLLTQLLALARAESNQGAAAIPMAPVDLIRLARDIAIDQAQSALKADVNLSFEASVDALYVTTAADLATELLCNLVDNAISYNRRGGEVIIEVRPTPGGAVVSVEDNGPGIKPEERQEVFTRFRRLARDQSRPGSGLGLAIVKALAEAIGATVTLRDRPGGAQGLVAEVFFPSSSEIAKAKAAIAPVSAS